MRSSENPEENPVAAGFSLRLHLLSRRAVMHRLQRQIWEKQHRLPREAYRGEITVALTACIQNAMTLFTTPEVVNPFIDRLRSASQRSHCHVLIYCFMPEHLHGILQGFDASADTWRAMVDFKQATGYWLGQNKPATPWQKDFYDHIIRADEDLAAQVRYFANNPVRRGLVAHWQDYPFTGSIGIDLDLVFDGIRTL
jgi:putative transposase